MAEAKAFRCPFEVKGQEDGTIVEVNLSEDKGERLAAMCAAIARLYEDRTRSAIRFVLPASVLAQCSSNESCVR